MSNLLPWTEEEKRHFTEDETAHKAIGNIFCRGQVADIEADPKFYGWVICGNRPLSVFRDRAGTSVVGYGGIATIFRTRIRKQLPYAWPVFSMQKAWFWSEPLIEFAQQFVEQR